MNDLFFFRIAGLLTVDQFKQTFSKDFTESDLDNILNADPTYTPGQTSIGSYSMWLLKRIQSGESNDLAYLSQLLTLFNKYKPKLQQKDIYQYLTINQVENTLNDLKIQNVNKYSGTLPVVYEDDTWIIWCASTPEQRDAYNNIAHGTRWCTYGDTDECEKHYLNYLPLYVIMNKSTKERYQVDPKSSTNFMNEQDITVKTIQHMTKGLYDFLSEVIPDLNLPSVEDAEFFVENKKEIDYFCNLSFFEKIINKYWPQLLKECNRIKSKDILEDACHKLEDTWYGVMDNLYKEWNRIFPDIDLTRYSLYEIANECCIRNMDLMKKRLAEFYFVAVTCATASYKKPISYEEWYDIYDAFITRLDVIFNEDHFWGLNLEQHKDILTSTDLY